MNEEKCKPENLKNLKKEENEMRTYDKDEKLEEINNGGKQSCGKGNSKNRRGQKIKGQHRSTSPQRHQLDKEASRRRHMTTEGGKSLAMNLKSSTDHRTRDMHTPTILTSAVQNTGGRSGPQGLEEPTSDEVLRELHAYSTVMNPEEIQEITKSRITPNPRRQLPEHSREGGMEVSTPEARHQLPVSSEDSDETTLLHLGPGRGRRVVYSIGVNRPEETADIRRVKTAREVT
ncbi:hypothetical protein Tco_0858474 [Tanacetum coccineum]|uniref:Uncharacterized protein n=1 Tax=Tanacetum coccineum TaxID=301880 RepID=A0ABQ5BBF0_9ASTR